MDLQHHGVKGMHWGIRRYQPYPKGSKKVRETFRDKRRSKKELKAIEKMEEFDALEKRYNNVKKKGDPSFDEMRQYKYVDVNTPEREVRYNPDSMIKKYSLNNKQINRVIKSMEKDPYIDVMKRAHKEQEREETEKLWA